jgi:hypothetical protein
VGYIDEGKERET